MEIYVFDESLNEIGVIDTYVSLIWVQRYYTEGDFELYISADSSKLSLLKENFYLVRDDTDSAMIIKNINLKTDVEKGDFFIISGPCTKSIIRKRIVWNQTVLNGKAEKGIYRLLRENIISPEIPERKISNFLIGSEHGWSEECSQQITGQNLADVIPEIGKQFGWGYKVKIDLSEKAFVFELFSGDNKGVTFSNDFDNLISSDYVLNSDEFANVALVAGEGEGISRRTQTVGNAKGIGRNECFVDARNISSNDGSISESEYNDLLKQAGTTALSTKQKKEGFNAEINPDMTYKYKEDYNLGDICHIVNDYGVEADARITEIIESFSETGCSVLPTFEEWSVKT